LVFLIQPSQVGTNSCSPTSGILITNHQVDDVNGITLILSNQSGAPLTVDVDVTGTADGLTTTGTLPAVLLGTTSLKKSVPLAPPVGTKRQYSLSVAFSYSDRDGLPRTVTSTCNGTSS